MSIREPFAYVAAARHPLKQIADDIGAQLVTDSFAWPDADARIAHTESGEVLHYDALILCLGARIQARYEHAITLDDGRIDELAHGLIQDIEGGYIRKLAFVSPPRMTWPLPLYELALMSAKRAFDMNVELTIMLLTPEDKPLQIFGAGASRGVSELLTKNRVELIASASCEVPEPGRVVITPNRRKLAAERPATKAGRRDRCRSYRRPP